MAKEVITIFIYRRKNDAYQITNYANYKKTHYRNNDTVCSVIGSWIEMTERRDMKALVADMAEKMYSDAYIKRYRLFMPLLTVLQKPKDVLDSHNDHRIVMSLSVISSIFGGEILGYDAVDKSYPDFFNVINNLGIKTLFN